MAKVMLIAPSLVASNKDPKKSGIHLGLLYIGSWLLNRGHEVKLIQTECEGWDNVRSETESTTEYGLSDNEIIRRIEEFGPDVIGLTLLATVSYQGFLNIARMIKKNFSEIPLVVGGAHATALPELTLRDSGADWLAQGEGERVMERVVENLSSPEVIQTMPGIAYLNNLDVFCTNPRGPLIEDLDEVGDLRLELIEDTPVTKEPTYAGSAHGRKYIDVFFSRGCPLNCRFCFTPQMWLRQLRHHSLPWIRRQVQRMTESGYGHVMTQDDNFSRMGDWSVKVMKIFHQAGMTWENNGGLEMEHLSDNYIAQMARTNCTTLFIPLNLRTDKTDCIPVDVADKYQKVLQKVWDYEIDVFASHIMGFPEQTLEGMKRQVEFARILQQKKTKRGCHIVYVYSLIPGTRMWMKFMEPTICGEWKLKKDAGITITGGWKEWFRYAINTPQIGGFQFSFEEMEKLFYESFRIINGEKIATAWFGDRQWPKEF